MTVHLVDNVMKMIDEQAEKIVEDIVQTMKDNAPVDSGQMRDSISAKKVGKYRWIISTHATRPATNTSPAFEYPARIELGQTVYPTKAKALWFHGRWHKKSAASKKSGFAKKTVSKYT